MSLNKYMHPRNPFYNNSPDFKKLASIYSDFAKYVKSTNKIDFKDPESIKSLCCTLLKHLFGNTEVKNSFSTEWELKYFEIEDLNIDLPINHLIPRVPQRINYILWIEDLLNRPDYSVGIDIGSEVKIFSFC